MESLEYQNKYEEQQKNNRQLENTVQLMQEYKVTLLEKEEKQLMEIQSLKQEIEE